MKCDVSNWGCVYHACMSDDCQLEHVARSGFCLGETNCNKTFESALGGLCKTPKSMFNMDFGQAIEALCQGKMVRRKAFQVDVFVFRQVPSNIPAAVIPGMQSLPEAVKEEFIHRLEIMPIVGISYCDQLAIVKDGNRIRGWSPSVEDAMASDWQIYEGI